MDFQKFLALGVNHHLLYIDKSWEPMEHARSLNKLLSDERIELLDVWIPTDGPVREREIAAIRASDKQIVYNIGTRKGKSPAHPATLDPDKRKYSIEFYKRELESAIAVRAIKVVTNSGPDVPENRKAAFEALVDFYVEICQFVSAQSDMVILVEPTDRETDKRKFIGPSVEAVKLAKRLHQAGCGNFASMVDMCHLPLMGESIDWALHSTQGYIGHIHLGNCILKDPNHPLFGDKHVPLGIPGGEYDVEDVADLLTIGLQIGYFNQRNRGTVSLEMRPYPNKTSEESLDIHYQKFEQAWKMAYERFSGYEIGAKM
jgi:hypothetical protein